MGGGGQPGGTKVVLKPDLHWVSDNPGEACTGKCCTTDTTIGNTTCGERVRAPPRYEAWSRALPAALPRPVPVYEMIPDLCAPAAAGG